MVQWSQRGGTGSSELEKDGPADPSNIQGKADSPDGVVEHRPTEQSAPMNVIPNTICDQYVTLFINGNTSTKMRELAPRKTLYQFSGNKITMSHSCMAKNTQLPMTASSSPPSGL
ncbi:uncharacterized protein LOC106668345 [Cimex lectularius]|uniref:Uncharacterized protein n=1 Tax=Cimex lectularius TaxID=79782 RepID=A0A8I6RYQ5_CIMLE|nr:uncharacterized protein LOC106668345 [Cimex lectularius]